MFDYPLLEALYAVEKAGDFESVARSHGVSKSAISQSLKLLEERLGATTVCRDTIQPTHFGSQLCRHLEQIKLLENKFLGNNAHLFPKAEQSSVSVTVSINDDSLSGMFQDALVDARRQLDHFYLDIEVSNVEDTIVSLRSGKCLAAITTKSEPLSGFDCYPLGQHRYHATATPKFFNQNFADGVNLDALQKATSLKYAKDDDLIDRWTHSALGSRMSCANNTHTLQSSQGIVEACSNDKAWAITSALQVSQYLDSGKLVELLPGRVMKENLYWQINQCVSDPLDDLTNTIRKAAEMSLFQYDEFCN